MNLSRLVIRGFALALAFAIMLPPLSRAFAADSETATEFGIYCAKCHGTGGHGDGPNASTLKTKPRDFTDCATMKKISDDTIFKAIKEGGAAVNLPNDMPPWGQAFDDGEIKQLAAYVRTFCKN
jgi:cytochrome c oxidase cbb3-type subunit III